MAETYSAGIVTAYGAARRGGYTGTYEEFCIEQAGFAEAAQQVRRDKESVEQTVETFSEETVPEAVRSVTGEGTRQIGLVTDAGDDAVEAVGNAGTENVSSVNRAGSAKVEAVNNAGTTQVNNVNAAGATQVQNVEDKGEEVLESIPADYTALSNKVNNPVTGLDTKAPAIINTASGAIASFSDGADSMPVKKLVVAVEPVQDLHGYDNPWPGGGGKNLLDFRTKASGNDNGITYTNNDGVITANGTAQGYSFYQSPTFTLSAGSYIVSGRPSGSNCSLTIYNATTSQGIANPPAGGSQTITLSEDTQIYARVLIGSGTANNEVLKPMICLSTATDPTVFSHYSNICPISGWTGAEVTGTGVNVWDEEWEGGTIDTSGAPVADPSYIRSKNFIPVLPETSYCCASPAQMRVFYYDENKDFISFYGNFSAQAFTTPSNCRFIKCRPVNTYGTTYNHDISINYPATDTAYHAYTGSQISITFPSSAGTVYGATLTINPDRTGQLVVDRAGVDLGTLTWTQRVASNVFNAILPYNPTIVDRDVTRNDCLCSVYKNGRVDSIVNGLIEDSITAGTSYSSLETQVIVCDGTYTSAEDFKNGVSGVQFIYPLATPVTYTLTPTEIDGILSTLYGTNNIWADAGDVSVEYPCDTRLYIDNKITQAIAAALNA